MKKVIAMCFTCIISGCSLSPVVDQWAKGYCDKPLPERMLYKQVKNVGKEICVEARCPGDGDNTSYCYPRSRFEQ